MRIAEAYEKEFNDSQQIMQENQNKGYIKAVEDCIKICNKNYPQKDIEELSEFQDGARSAINLIKADLLSNPHERVVKPKIMEPREDDFVNTIAQTILAWHSEDGDINNLINTLIEKDIKNLFSDWQGYVEELSNFSA